MSSVTTSDAEANLLFEKRCVNLAFIVGGHLVLFGLFGDTAAYLIAGSILFSGSTIATVIRNTSSERRQ